MTHSDTFPLRGQSVSWALPRASPPLAARRADGKPPRVRAVYPSARSGFARIVPPIGGTIHTRPRKNEKRLTAAFHFLLRFRAVDFGTKCPEAAGIPQRFFLKNPLTFIYLSAYNIA